jgi:hypothetical protein
MHLSRCLGAHPEMWEVVPSRGELLVFSACSLHPKLPELPKHPELRRLVPVCPAFLFAASEKETEPERKGEEFRGT